MTAESISVLQTDRCVPMTLLWRRKSSVLHIWNVRSWRIRFYTIPIPAQYYEDFESDISRESYVVIAKLSAILRVSMRWTAAISRNSKMCVRQ